MNKNNEKDIPKDEVSGLSNFSKRSLADTSVIFDVRLSDIIRKYVSTGINHLSKINEETYMVDCPFCKKFQSLHISDKYHTFACLNCRAFGNAIDFVKKIEHISTEEAIKGLKTHFELTRTPIRDIMKYEKKS